MSVHLYHIDNGRVTRTVWNPGDAIPAGTLWLDLISPTREEETAVEQHLGMEIPTREEMREIEVSNRLYQEQGYLFMTATLVSKFESNAPELHAATFIVSDKHLITIRYSDPLPFRNFANQILTIPAQSCSSISALLGLLEAVVNRAADILETIGQDIDSINRQIFTAQSLAPNTQKPDYQKALQHIGHTGDSASKASESLITLWRLVAYASQNIRQQTAEITANLAALSKDISALSDHASFTSNKLSFLLDATLGMISIEQNDIIKIFSIAAVVFLPPTLIASIYGMNFKHMPELEWLMGYPYALGMMVLVAIIPLLYFKSKKWL